MPVSFAAWIRLVCFGIGVVTNAVALDVATQPAPAPVRLDLRGQLKSQGARYRLLRIGLYGVDAPFTETTLAGPGGDFRFSRLTPGSYVLSVMRRGLGEVRQSVVVSPGLADKKGVVRIEVPFSAGDAALSRTGGVVSAKHLKVPDKALRKYTDAERKLSKHDVDAARVLLEQAVALCPTFTAAWNSLGVLAYQTRDYISAEQHFRTAHGIEKDSYEPIVNLGGVLLGLRRLRESLPFNEQAAAMRPKDPLANGQLGMNLMALGRFEEAEAHLLLAKRADPNHFTLPQLYLSELLLRRGDRVGAIRELEDLLARRPDGPDSEFVRKKIAQLRSL